MVIPFAICLSLAAPPPHVSARVEIDIDPLVANGSTEHPDEERALAEDVRAATEEGLRKALEAEGVSLGEGDADATISVRFDWKVYLDSHYQVVIEVERDGTATQVSDALECRLCEPPKVAAVVAGQAPKIAAALEAHAVQSDPPDEPPPHGDPPPDEPPPDTEPPKGKAVGRLGYAGIVTTAIGLGGVIGGAVLLSKDDEINLEDNRRFEAVDDYRPAGIGTLAVGAGLLVTGAVLIAIDQTVGKKKRNRAARVQHTIAPAITTDTVGLRATIRF